MLSERERVQIARPIPARSGVPLVNQTTVPETQTYSGHVPRGGKSMLSTNLESTIARLFLRHCEPGASRMMPAAFQNASNAGLILDRNSSFSTYRSKVISGRIRVL